MGLVSESSAPFDMAKKYYKVVATYNLSYFSVISILNVPGDFESEFNVEYKINEWVKPKVCGAPLMCFASLEDAINFKNQLWNNRTIIIFECEVRNPRRTNKLFLRPLRSNSDMKNIILNNLKLKKQKKRIIQFHEDLPPAGTVFCDELKLLKKID